MLLYGLEQPTNITDNQFKACRASAVKFATAEAYRLRWQAQMKFWEAAVLEVLHHNKESLYLPALETSGFYKKNMAQVNKGEVVYVPDDYVHFESEGESSDTIDTSIAIEDTEMTMETTETVSTKPPITYKRKQPEDSFLDATLFLHAKVLLKAEGAIVGMGEVSVLGPAISHGVQMDASSVTIEVQQVFLKIRLPFPSMGAEFLTECQGSYVRWPVIDLLLVQAPSKDIPSTSGIKAQEAVAATAETITNQASTLHTHTTGYSRLGTSPLATEEEEENVVPSQEKHAIHVNTL